MRRVMMSPARVLPLNWIIARDSVPGPFMAWAVTKVPARLLIDSTTLSRSWAAVVPVGISILCSWPEMLTVAV